MPLTSVPVPADEPEGSEDGMERESPEVGAAARAVGTLLAPVVACLRDDREGFDVLVESALESGTVSHVLRAAPTVAHVYLRLAPPPDGVRAIVDGYEPAAVERFEDLDVVTLGAGCLHVAAALDRVPAPLAEMAREVFVHEALEHGEVHALEGALASVWWCAFLSARLRGVDPIEEAAAVCRYAARVA